MSRGISIFLLLLAAVLEAGGDAVLRVGLHTSAISHRIMLFLLAAVILFAYGWTVNASPWDFGRLLGLYVVFFFVIAQITSWIVFRQPPSFAVLAGGVLIVLGGIVISFGKA
jgi:drug/metabolite transporter superfamily protein YnfA